jgi:hypothetical protein
MKDFDVRPRIKRIPRAGATVTIPARGRRDGSGVFLLLIFMIEGITLGIIRVERLSIR